MLKVSKQLETLVLTAMYLAERTLLSVSLISVLTFCKLVGFKFKEVEEIFTSVTVLSLEEHPNGKKSLMNLLESMKSCTLNDLVVLPQKEVR